MCVLGCLVLDGGGALGGLLPDDGGDRTPVGCGLCCWNVFGWCMIACVVGAAGCEVLNWPAFEWERFNAYCIVGFGQVFPDCLVTIVFNDFGWCLFSVCFVFPVAVFVLSLFLLLFLVLPLLQR